MLLEIIFSGVAKYPDFFFFFLCIKTGQNRISYIFQEIVIPEIHVRLFEDFQNLIALQV